MKALTIAVNLIRLLACTAVMLAFGLLDGDGQEERHL